MDFNPPLIPLKTKTFKHYFFLLLLACITCGCFKTPVLETTSLSSAHQKFLKICSDEYKYTVKVIPVGETVWIYVPSEDSIFDIKATPKKHLPPAAPKESWSIQFLESAYKDKTLSVHYDMNLTKKYDINPGYQNKWSEEQNKKQQNIMSAISRTYFDVGNVPGDITFEGSIKDQTHHDLVKAYVKTDKPPEFVVIIYADIKRGIAIKTISYFNDMKQALSSLQTLPYEEYVKRYVSEIYGDEDLIGDKTGSRLKTEEIHLGDFLAKQIENRIKFQFTQSGFPPTGEVQDEIWNIIAQTCRLYNFKDFEKIKLTDLQTEKESTFDKSQL